MNNPRPHNNDNGAVMVEFAIILPLLVVLLFGVTEIGRALYQQNMLHRALTVGARYLTHKEGIVEVDAANGTCTATEDATFSFNSEVAIAKNLILCGQQSCTTTQPILPNLTDAKIDITLPSEAVEFDSTNGLYGCVIKINAYAEFAGLFDTVVPFTNLTSPNLNAQTEVRYIGY